MALLWTVYKLAKLGKRPHAHTLFVHLQLEEKQLIYFVYGHAIRTEHLPNKAATSIIPYSTNSNIIYRMYLFEERMRILFSAWHILLINIKTATGILIFISKIYCWHFNINLQDDFHAQLRGRWKKVQIL